MEKCKPLDQDWFQAVERGNLPCIQKLLKDINDINFRGTYALNNVKHNGVTGLIVAAHLGNKELVRWFLTNKADANASTHLGWRAIHFAAKRGHVATIDILCSSGAAVDPVTLNNDTPLSLALHSHMRDSARKLVNLGAQVDRLNESLLYHYIHRGILPAEVLSRTRNAPNSPMNKRKLACQTDNSMPSGDSARETNIVDAVGCVDHPDSNDFAIAVHDSQVIINQLQCQSTTYDLELARRKRELIRRLPTVSSLSQQSANILVQQTQRLARADLPTFERLKAVRKVFTVLPLKSLSGLTDDGALVSLGSVIDPYLRLFEACMCESHCPNALAIELSVLSVYMVVLGGNVSTECNGTGVIENANTNSASFTRASKLAFYITRLLRKLENKNNPQYRAGILAHLCRMLSCSNVQSNCHEYQNSIYFWPELAQFSDILVGLVRLGETLNQPINVARLAALIGLIGRRLSEVSLPSVLSSASHFSDLADILVGWGVDSNSITRGINLDSLYSELRSGLSSWWLNPPNKNVRSDVECPNSKEEVPSLNSSMRGIICNLLEDSEKSMDTSVMDCQASASNQTVSCTPNTKSVSDPTCHLISVDLFLSVLSSIIEGVCSQLSPQSQEYLHQTLGLSQVTSMDWIDRLLQLVKSAHTCYRFSWMLWHPHGPINNSPRVSFSVVDKIECTVLRLLDCLSHTALPQTVYNYLASRLSDSSQLTMSPECLNACLRLLRRFILQCASDPTTQTAVTEILHASFGVHSAIHSYKFHVATGSLYEPMSKLVLRTLCFFAKEDKLHDALYQLATLDLKLAMRFLKVTETNRSPTADDHSKCEKLGLFSLALFSAIMRHTTTVAQRSKLRRQVLEQFRQECALKWMNVPTRVRIAIVAFLHDISFLTSLPPIELVQLIATISCVESNSAFEYNQVCTFAKAGLENKGLTLDDRCGILINLCKLAETVLHSSQPLHTRSVDPFTTCMRVLIAHSFTDELVQNKQLNRLLFRLSKVALCSNFPERNEVCSDLILTLSVSKGHQRIHTSMPHLGLAWYTSRRPDRSATALAIPSGSSQISSSGVVGSGSAYPSLPAVAGVLGILTRGAPYSSTTLCSRLRILEEPSDWIRRLFHLICPIPSEMNSRLFIASAEETVLWYAAWTMIDYKLKVAPWVSPLKTFLSLEGTMRAILRPYTATEIKSLNLSNPSSVMNFHVASSLALSRQPWSRQIRQAQSLTTFIGFLERLIANATKGFSVSLPRPVPSACTFFAANEVTCSQWFGRVRGLLLRIADDWPLPPVGNECSSGDVPASVLYHAYTPLTAIMQSDPSTLESWLSGVACHGVSCDTLVRVAKALYRLSAWEELQALSEWTVRSFGTVADGHNPFVWLEGLAQLARGHWDNALKIFRSFIDYCVQQKQIAQNLRASPAWIVSFSYTTEVLLQCYMDEGDLQAAFALRDFVKPTLKLAQNDEPNTNTVAISSLKINCMRLSCFEKLTRWSASTVDTLNYEEGNVQYWSHEKLTTKFCCRLVDAALTIKSHKTNNILLNSETLESLSDLVADVRLASSATLISSSKLIPCPTGVQGGLTSEGTLCSWLTRADLLLNSPSQCLNDCDLVNCRLNTVSESSWRHLLVNPDSQNARLNSGLQGCRWACDTGNFQLAGRLLLRELQALSFFGKVSVDTSGEKNLENLYNIVRSTDFVESDSLSEIQRLLFHDCLAQLLWTSNNASSAFDPKMAAIDTLSQGLRTVISKNVSSNILHHAARCHAATQVALRLFDWLEEPCQRQCNQSWVEWINRDHLDSSREPCPTTCSVVSHLNFFSRLVDEPWMNGLLLVPSTDLSTSSELSGGSSSHFTQDSHSVWLSRLLMMTTRLAPNGSSAAAWLRMASWCYTRGQTMVEQTRALARDMLSEPAKWTNPQTALDSTACPVLQPGDYQLITTLLEQHGLLSASTSADENQANADSVVPRVVASLLLFLTPNQLPSESNYTSATLRQSEGILRCGSLPNLRLTKLCPDDETDQLICQQLGQHLQLALPQLFPQTSPPPVTLLESLHRLTIELTQRQYTLHTSAAQAYATYLTVAGQRSEPGSTRTEEPITKLDTTTATLKLLDLLSCPSRALRNLIAGFLMHGEPASQAHELNTLAPEAGIRLPKYPEARSSGATLGGPAIWEACLHQVLVRLSLPDPTIRNCLVALLTRLILTGTETKVTQLKNCITRWRSSSLRFAAHLVFPSVVAAMDSVDKPVKVTALTKNASTVSSETCHLDAFSRTSGFCFIQIVSALQAAGLGGLVRQVETFVLELQRITLLWEELWLGSLLQHLDELNKKVTLLETETKRSVQLNHLDHQSTAENNVADKENRASGIVSSETKRKDLSSSSVQDVLRIKFVAVAQPTLDLISKLSSLTLDVQPETPHEEWFQKTFGSIIHDLRETLSHPTELMDAKHLLSSVRQLIFQLQTVHQPTSNAPVNRVLYAESRVPFHAAKPSLGSVLHLSLSHLSPRLTQMHFGDQSHSKESATIIGIPLPGRPGLESARLVNRVAILPTKTKPKRLLFRAQNGQTYPYLLKGLEDLRLDDRIMRLFELVNVALAHQKGLDLTQLNQMCARTYAITPLGVRAGLLQMVHGAVPLFSLYKRWQIRSIKPPSAGEDSDPSTVPVPRPGELFHARLKESLLAAGLPYQPQARNTWPVEILREVFLSLESETPSDLLARELWASNPSAASWWSASRTFCRSIGLMSMLGYLVGLGDRHLDNLLADLTTGQLIHIDYNVCFDKGRSLRVAERVPFRMTQILRHTLGPLAQDRLVRGTFRIAAEQTLSVARSVVDPFLIQMKAFLIDPLVDWQDKKQTNSHSNVMISDFTHLSAYYGGGSSATRQHFWTSCMRKQSRVGAEVRTYAGLLATRLYELCYSTSLLDVCSALETARSYFQVWVTWYQAARDLSDVEHSRQMLTKCSTSDLDTAESHCRMMEVASTSVSQLRTSLYDQLVKWKNEVEPLYKIFSQLADPTWLPALTAMQNAANSELGSALTQYYLLARIYLTHPDLCAANSLHWIQEVGNLQTSLEQFLNGSDALEVCLDRFVLDTSRKPSHTTYNQLVTLLEKAIHRGKCAVGELQDSLQTYDTSEAGTLDAAIRPELDNLHLFVYDQGVFGVGAYLWALIEYLPGVIANILSLESDCDAVGQVGGESTPAISGTSSLDQVTLYAEYLTALLSVLHHQPSGTFRFTAGFEADVQREMAFMYAVRDATLCLFQLRTNLIHLLLFPATESALIDAASSSMTGETTDDLLEQFTGLISRYVTESDPVGLKDRVNQFLLNNRSTVPARDMRLHQVLLAVHLALTNTTTQMEEIAVRVRELTVTAPAWFYVDIIAQSVSNLLARCSSWRSGATSLWGWESTSRAELHSNEIESDFRCSWIDEIYAMGLMAFVSVLEEGRAHWNAIRGTSVTPTQDLAMNQFFEPVDRFISRLVSRTGLASLLAFAFGRLFCSLIEDTGFQMRRLLMESEHNAKVAGVHPVVLQLSAEKLAETVSIHLTAVQPFGVHHLRGPASNLIHRLSIHASKANERLSTAVKLELARKHLDRLQQSLTVLKWISPTLTLVRKPDAVELSVTTETDIPDDSETYLANYPTLESALSTLKQAIANSSDNSPNIDADNPTLCDIAKAVCFAEELRTLGVESCSGYTDSLHLLRELKQALNDEEKCAARLTDLEKTLLTLKNKYGLLWPASDWMDQRCVAFTDGQTSTKRTLRAQIQTDFHTAKAQFNRAREQIARIKVELVIPLGVKGDTESLSTTPTDQSAIVLSRHANKPSGGKHGRSGIPSSPGLTLSSSPNDSLGSATIKQSPLITKLRAALATLQSDRLSEIRQLVKLLNRYESARAHFVVGGSSSQVQTWSSWLEKHQTWTNLVLSTLRQISKFLTQLGTSNRSVQPKVSSKPQQDQTNEPNDLEDLNTEAEFAERLLHDCLLIHSSLWSALLEPLFEAILSTVEPDESLSKLVSNLLTPVHSQVQSWIAVDCERSLSVQSCSDKTSKTLARDPHSTSLINFESSDSTQDEINPQALDVWCRTRDRLMGFDPLLSKNANAEGGDNSGGAMPVDEQVDACIRAATDIDNLSLMYEGWTAWV